MLDYFVPFGGQKVCGVVFLAERARWFRRHSPTFRSYGHFVTLPPERTVSGCCFPPVNSPQNTNPRQRLSRILLAAFFFALLMGAGPGIYLVNDYAAAGGTLLGMPALYAWAVGWCAIEAAIVLIAFLTVWRSESE